MRMCVLCIVSTTVYAVFNCVCITQSSVCSVCMYHMQLRPEADGCWQPITTEGPLSAYSSSSSSLFIDPYADVCQIPCLFYIEVLVAPPASVSLWFAYFL